MNISGEILELWRYPVKSMRGEPCDAIELERRGVSGDRRFAVIDAEGRIGSGKDTRRFRKIDGLLSLQAHLDGPIPQIRFPDGRLVSAADPGADSVLSDFLGKPVRLMPDAETS